jgi:hypothetical protein
MASLKAPPNESCPRCWEGHEYFWYLHLYEFDVELARKFVDDDREPVEVDEESVRLSVEESVLYECHVNHVDPTIPGIITHVFYPAESGERIHAHVLIDGHHRAARCMKENRPFFAYLLSEEESIAVLVKSPEMAAADADSPVLAGATR